MSDKSFGDHINRNVVKNSLLSSAVIGLSLEDLTHKAVLLPATPSQGQVTRLDQPQGSQARTLAHADHDKPSFPSGDAFTNITLSNTPPSNTFPHKIDSENNANSRSSASVIKSKASVKFEDDFDVNEYIARLQGTRYVSAPLHSHIKEDQNANLEAEESLEEINLNESGNEVPIQQSLTADIAQNFSQLPAVLPHVASAVFSSFSNMLSMKSREQTPDDAKSSGYQEVQFERAEVGVPLMGVEESTPKDFGLPPKEPPVTGVGSYRITSKKKYAQIPGLSYGNAAQNVYHNQNIPEPYTPGGQVFMTPTGLDRQVAVLHDNATNRPEMPFISPGPNDAFKTTEASGVDHVNKMLYAVDTNIFNPVASDVRISDVAAGKPANIFNVMETATVIFPANESPSNVSVKEGQPSMFTPIDHKDIASPRLPIIPPPPMFSNLSRSSQAAGKSVLPPSVARRISANQPLIKSQAMPTPTFSENIFVPAILETSDPLQSTEFSLPPCITPERKPQSMSQFSISSNVPMTPQENSVLLFTPPENPSSSSAGAPFCASDADLIQPSLTGASYYTPTPAENIQQSTIGMQFFAPSHPITSQPSSIHSEAPSIAQSPFGTGGSCSVSSGSSILPANIPASNAPLSTVTAPSSAPFIPMFPPTSQMPPAFFNTQAPTDPHLITQLPPGVTLKPETNKPLVEPPKGAGQNFRMIKRRPQYYSGPIEGVGDISNNVKPILAPVIPVPSVDTNAYQGFFSPEQQQTVDQYKTPNVEQTTLPFGINTQSSLEVTSRQYAPFDINQSQQKYVQDYKTAFDLSRPTLDAFDPPKQEAKGFGIIGSLKSKLSSIDINKIQSTVTTFFDPAYNEAKGETALETASYVQQQYGQHSHEQSNFEIMAPNVEQNPYSHFASPQGYSHDTNNQFYQTQNVYNYGQNEGQTASSYFTDASTSSHQVYNTAQNINTQYSGTSQNYSQENIPHIVDNISSLVAQESPEVDFYNPVTVQEDELPKVVNYQQEIFKKPCLSTSKHFVSPNVGPHGAIGDFTANSSINPTRVMDPVAKPTRFFESPLVVSNEPKLEAFGMAYNATNNTQADSIQQSRIPFSAPLPPAISFFDSPIIITGAQESNAKTVDLTEELEKLALAEEIAIASSPFQAIGLKISASSESKVIDTSALVKAVGLKTTTIALDKNVQNYAIKRKAELGTDQKGISLIESLSKDTTPVVAVSSVPLFGLSAMIAEKTQEIANVEKDLQSVCLLDSSKEVKPLMDQSFSLFKNIAAENKSHEEPVKQSVGLSISDVKNVLLIEPPLEDLGTILQRKAISSLIRDLPETEVKSEQHLSEDKDSSWNLDAAMVTSKDNVHVLFDKKASGFFDHLIAERETPVEGKVEKRDIDTTEHESDFNICETCREVNSPEGKETENVTNKLIENINSSIQLSNAVEVLLTESNPTASDQELEENSSNKQQFDEINQITEETIETIQGQSANELLDDVATSSNNSYGWNTEQLAYASIAAIDPELVTGVNPTNIGFITDDKYNTAIDPEYTFKLDPNAVGFFGDNSLFFDNVPNNASDEIKAEFKTHEDVVPQEMSIPSAPPAEEDDSKSDGTGGLDVHSIEQDANKDFPLEEDFIIEPSETDDDKIEFRERKKSSEDSVHDTFTGRIEKFKSKAESEYIPSDNSIYLKSAEVVTSPTSMASYFDTGNYAAETHYKKFAYSPTNIIAFQGQHPIDNAMNNLKAQVIKEGEMPKFFSEDVFRLPPGFEDDLRCQYIKTNSDKNNELFIPETSTQTHTTTSTTFNISDTRGFYANADLKTDTTILTSEIKHSDYKTVIGQCEKLDTLKPTLKDNDIKRTEDMYKYETPMLVNAFGATNLLIKDHTQALAGRTELKDITLHATEPIRTQTQHLPDPINFFSPKIDEKEEAKTSTDPVESFSRLASYFSMPPAQPDHSKSFFELSQSQNHYRHVSNPDPDNIIKGQLNRETQANIQNLMHDLTSSQNINFGDEIVQTVNHFSVEYVVTENIAPKLETIDINTRDVKNMKENNLDSLKSNGHNRTSVEDDVDSSIQNYNVKEEVDSKHTNVEESEHINTINICEYCCNTKLIDIKNYKVKTAADSNTREDREANMSEKDSGSQRKSVSVDFRNCGMDEEAQDGVTVVHENRSSSEYSPVRHHWFYRVDVDDKSLWRGFSMTDSNALEVKYLSADLTEDTLIPTDGGRFDVNIVGRLRIAVYWKEKPTNVRRCSWFYKGTTDARYVPYTEAVADKLEEEYRHGVTTGEWHRRLVLPNNELVVMHGPAVMVHFLHGGCSDSFSSPPQTTSRPRVVRRGCEESEIEDPEPSSIDHLLLLCHGVGSACDMRFRSVEEVVEDFRATSLQLLQSHYRNSYDNGIVSRVEVLPISWHAQLHVGEGGVDKRLNKLTLESIPRLRAFTNHTVLDALFYTSPVYHQTIIDTVCSELNRIYELFKTRNPAFKGGVSLGGHSLGSVILYDLLCHQTPETPLQPKSSAHKTYLPGTSQPLAKYPQLQFPPAALYALGSPIAIFECIRGVEALGMDFALPTCKHFFNIFHPYDPIAYRIEPLINPLLQDAKPYLIPHHKGRKRMHLELKDTMVRVGADLKQKLIESLRTTWNKWKASPPPPGQLEKVVEEEMEKEQLCEEVKEEQINAELTSPEMLGKLNDGRRIDYVLQEAPLEMINEYLFAMSSHVGYWESEDTMLLMLREIYSSLGVQPDCTVPQQSMTVTRTTKLDEATIVNETEYPSTSRGSPC